MTMAMAVISETLEDQSLTIETKDGDDKAEADCASPRLTLKKARLGLVYS